MGRPNAPQLRCRICQARPERISDSALSFGSPDSKLGIVLVRAECHGEKRDIAFSFKWLAANRRPVEIFGQDPPVQDFGLRELRDLDGIGLPEEIQRDCGWQLATIAPDRPIDARFLRAMGRLPEINQKNMTPQQASEFVASMAVKLSAAIRKSGSTFVATAEITDLTAGLARVAEHIFKQFGTPETASPNYIGEVIPNSADTDQTTSLFHKPTPLLK